MTSMPTEESPMHYVSTEEWHRIRSWRKDEGSVSKCRADSGMLVLNNKQKRLRKRIPARGNGICEDPGELHVGCHGWGKGGVRLAGQKGRQSPDDHES